MKQNLSFFFFLIRRCPLLDSVRGNQSQWYYSLQLLILNSLFIKSSLFFRDSPPHVPVEELSTKLVINIIGNMSSTIHSFFPDLQVFPALGNHDYWPQVEQMRNLFIYYAEFVHSSSEGRFKKNSSGICVTIILETVSCSSPIDI